MSSYDALHRQCRTLENLFDAKLTSYAQLASAIGRPGHDVEADGAPSRCADLEMELEELLEKLEDNNAQLATLAATPDALSPSMQRAVQRHQELCRDYARDLRRTRANVQAARDQANLLSGVRNDIQAYKSSAADSLLEERGRIDSSHRMTDDLIAQAYETRADFSRQRASLVGISSRMQGVISQMPGINQVIGMIKSRRRRDAIILGVVIGLCFIGLVSYVWSW
ncbi:V-snare-domain-containing protein [Schizophyllum commune H4-8]|uniref:Golgi SNAP receptor complex member 1 n=1 Tax=Schizophyllum commune (strain H4-8 / FGSC 9210) TaxID=578458 RepID=D8PQ99_SCHCM|nr:V-snare-domain-containing protein [Schizophyllum commune H4-8]KAI5898229.1 V-snare-domain-containing protein [Schizophyllum commune H4-8]